MGDSRQRHRPGAVEWEPRAGTRSADTEPTALAGTRGSRWRRGEGDARVDPRGWTRVGGIRMWAVPAQRAPREPGRSLMRTRTRKDLPRGAGSGRRGARLEAQSRSLQPASIEGSAWSGGAADPPGCVRSSTEEPRGFRLLNPQRPHGQPGAARRGLSTVTPSASPQFC